MHLNRRALLAATGVGLCGLASPRRASAEATTDPMLIAAAEGTAALVVEPAALTPMLAYGGLAESGVLRYRPGADRKSVV